jgi:hypothetical protein
MSIPFKKDPVEFNQRGEHYPLITIFDNTDLTP